MKMKAKQLLLTIALTLAATTAAWGQDPPVAAYTTAAGAQPDINFSGYDLTTAAGILQNATTLTLRGSWTYDDMENLKASLKPGGYLLDMNTALRTINMTEASLISVSFQDAFYDCQALQEVIFPQATYEAAVTFRDAFQGCLALTTVTNLDKFTQVTDFFKVFAYCESLQTIMLPIGSKDRNGVDFANAFKDCPG